MKSGDGVRLSINEVAPRDGFQMECRFIPTEEKIALINELGTLGYARIEVTSFTSPKAIPALRDAEAVMCAIARNLAIIYTALIPNVRGAERAIECEIDEFNIVMSVSETHNLANLRMTREQSFRQLGDVIALAKQHAIPVNVSLSTVFGCPMEGEIEIDEVVRWVERFAQLGARGVTLCDTTGMAYPNQVETLCGRMLRDYPQLAFTAHFHNTRGMGLANTLAAIEAGIRIFDTSLGGIGGCPYAPGATGNVPTEDVVHMLELQGYETGVRLDGLLRSAARLEVLVGQALPGQVHKAGLRLKRHSPPPDIDEIRMRAQSRQERPSVAGDACR
jgi:hydroxymethylglutaryl-CoA lyase